MPRSCTFIVNPLSGGFSPSRVMEAISALKKMGLDPRLVEAKEPEEAVHCSRGICREEEYPFIIVGAGDGTINSVVNGLSPGTATLAVIPFGTANVLAREVGITSISMALERIAAGSSRPVSVGVMEKDGTERRFLLMAGAGCDGEVVKGVRAPEKRLLHKGAYLLSALRLFFAWETGRLRVVSESGGIDCHSVIVCNAAKYGGEFVVAPRVSIFEPGFRVICVVDGTRMAFLRLALRLLWNKGLEGDGVSVFDALDVTIHGAKPVQADGDYYCNAPARVRSLEACFRLVV